MTNMKKKYQKPEIEVIDFEMEIYMLDSSLEGTEGSDDDEDPGNLEGMSNRHRGEWGNLWAED